MPENQTESNKKDKRLRKLLSGGAEIAGGAVGAALGFLAGDPAAAAALGGGGTVAAMALKSIGEEVGERLLGPREQVRVGAVLALAAAEINARLKAGQQIRDDDFFDQKSHGRSDADEVAESVLLKSQREPEEKKIPYMANLLANVAFDAQISAQMAHQLTKTAESLTYRQLCILKLAVVGQQLGLRAKDYRGQGSFSKQLYQVLYECVDLYHRGLINFGGEVLFGPSDVAPGNMKIQALGADLYNLMSLPKIPGGDLEPIAEQLR